MNIFLSKFNSKFNYYMLTIGISFTKNNLGPQQQEYKKILKLNFLQTALLISFPLTFWTFVSDVLTTIK